MYIVINLITKIKTVNLKIEKYKCNDKYHFINININVNINVNLNVNLYLNTEIKKNVISDINKFLSSSVKHYSVYCRIVVTVMIKICKNVTSV